jgi:hypothetical protein
MSIQLINPKKVSGNRPAFTVINENFKVITGSLTLVSDSIKTLTSQTAAQDLFVPNTTPIVVGSYKFECSFALKDMSGSSGTFGFALGGTATKTQAWMAVAGKGVTQSTLPEPILSYSSWTHLDSYNETLTPDSVSTNGTAFINGIINVTVAGTIIPQVSLTVAAAAKVQKNSYFKLFPWTVTP